MADVNRRELNEALRLLRVYHDQSRADLIDGLKISKSYLSEIESGSKQVSLDIVQKYAKVFGITPSSILFLGESLAQKKAAKSAERNISGKIRKLMAWISEVEQVCE